MHTMDGPRMILARTHSAQKIPINHSEPPIVQTGAEYITAQITSEKFVIKSKDDGIIDDLKLSEWMKLKYNNGKYDYIDISPRYSATKRNSIIQIELNTKNKGDKVEKGEIVAWNKNFNGDILTQGRNCTLAVMSYMGVSFEDGYVITDKMASEFETDTIQKISVVIPPNTDVIHFNNDLGVQTEPGSILIEFKFKNGNADNYIRSFDLIDNDFEHEIENFLEEGNETIKTISPGGTIVNVKIKVNDPDTTSQVVLDAFNKQNKALGSKKKIIKTINGDNPFLDNTDMTPLRTGGHKDKKNNVFDGALIEFFIKKPKTLEIGDKISNRFGKSSFESAELKL